MDTEGTLIFSAPEMKDKLRNCLPDYMIPSFLYLFLHPSVFCGIYALSIDAVRSEIMFLLYPVMGILAAKLILKEKYSRWQNLCIWVITLSAIGFCVIDYLL